MPRKPVGDRAMTDAERQRKRRERLRKETPVLTDRQKLIEAQKEIERLRKVAAAEPAKVAESQNDLAARPPSLSDELVRLFNALNDTSNWSHLKFSTPQDRLSLAEVRKQKKLARLLDTLREALRGIRDLYDNKPRR